MEVGLISSFSLSVSCFLCLLVAACYPFLTVVCHPFESTQHGFVLIFSADPCATLIFSFFLERETWLSNTIY
jgi:hypothetical protein